MIQDRRHPLRWLPGILLLLTLAGIFLPLISGKGLAFRDTAHFYSPSFSWQARQWRDGSVPLWNDQEGLGSDVVGDGSSSVFYPGKILLVALPCAWATRLNLYILAHLLLAAAGSYRLARAWNLERAAACLAAAAYSLSGPVLSLHANIPFLVGAAWLPWAFQAIDRLLRRAEPSAVLSLALVLALMVLGGDPQAAYHVGLAAVLYLLILPRRISGRSRRRGLGLLAGAALLAGLLSAIQLLPLLAQSRQSTRAAPDQPRSFYELQLHGSPAGEQLSGLLKGPENPYQPDPYQFSVAPWRLAELAWPNVSGQMYPQNGRWLRSLGGEQRIWTPTLYMGLWVMVLAWSGWSLRSSERPVRWLSWILLLSAIASLGLYGAGWILRQAGLHENPGSDPTGGLYWLMTVILPGYVKFRFPAKLWILFTLAGSLLSAWQMHKLLDGRRRRPARRLVLLAAAGAAGLLLLALLRPWLLEHLGRGQSDYLLGPLQAKAAYRGILLALLHGTLLALLLLGLLANLPSRLLGPLLVSLTILEIGAANSHLVQHVPGRAWETSSPMEILQHGVPATKPRPPERVFRAQWRQWKPRHWLLQSSPQRLHESVRWDRQTLLPRYQLLSPLGSLESSQSLQDRTLATLLDVGRRHGPRRPDGLREPDLQLLQSIGIRWLAGPGDWHPGGPSHRQDLSRLQAPPDNFSLWQIHSPAPFARVVFKDRRTGPLPERMSDLARQIEAELYPDGGLLDLTRLVLLHGEGPSQTAPPGETRLPSSAATIELGLFEPTRREWKVRLGQPAYLVLNQAYAPGWKAWSRPAGTARWQQVPLERANFIATALPLPAGEQQLLLRYQPAPVRTGAWLSLAGLGLLLILQIALRRRARPDGLLETG